MGSLLQPVPELGGSLWLRSATWPGARLAASRALVWDPWMPVQRAGRAALQGLSHPLVPSGESVPVAAKEGAAAYPWHRLGVRDRHSSSTCKQCGDV